MSFARFDPSGKLLAASRPDNTGVIWDLDTRAIIRWHEGHVKGVTAVEYVLPTALSLLLTYAVGRVIRDSSLQLQKTGTSSYGTWNLPPIHLTSIQPFDLMPRLSQLASIHEIGS